MKNTIQLPVVTPKGVFLAHYSEQGLVELNFPDGGNHHASRLTREGETQRRPALPAPMLQWHQTTTEALHAVLAGRAAKALPPLDWTGKTEFQQSVWRELLKLGPGNTRSYGEIAAAIGRPKAVRAVGGACGANPIPVLVPCHRVLAANKKLGGFSGGLDWKRRLLGREGCVMRNA